jgi:hypothetical protein
MQISFLLSFVQVSSVPPSDCLWLIIQLQQKVSTIKKGNSLIDLILGRKDEGFLGFPMVERF